MGRSPFYVVGGSRAAQADLDRLAEGVRLDDEVGEGQGLVARRFDPDRVAPRGERADRVAGTAGLHPRGALAVGDEVAPWDGDGVAGDGVEQEQPDVPRPGSEP